MYVGDYGNNVIRKIDTDGVIITIAGTGEQGSSGDGGPAVEAKLWALDSLAFDAAGNLYFVEFNARKVRKIDTNGVITTVAGTGLALAELADSGVATEVQLLNGIWIDVDPVGVLYISSEGLHRILRVDPDGTYTTIAGTGQAGFSGDGGSATEAELSSPSAIALGPDGSVYVSDGSGDDRNRIRRIDPDGIITTVAGTGESGFSGRGGPARAASLIGVHDFAFDPQGNLYFSHGIWNSAVESRVLRIDADGILTNVVGTGKPGSRGESGPAIDAELNRPVGLAFDTNGSLYILDNLNNRIRKIDSEGVITTIAGTGDPGLAGDGGLATDATITSPGTLAFDADNNLYVAEGPPAGSARSTPTV